MRAILTSFESRLQNVGIMAEREEFPAVYIKPDAGDDVNSGSRPDSPVKSIERGLELLLQHRNRRDTGTHGRKLQLAAQVASNQLAAAEAGLTDSSCLTSEPVDNNSILETAHVVDAATMLARAKNAEDDADPPRNSSPVERAHHSEYYEPRPLSPPRSAVRPQTRVESPWSAPQRLHNGTGSTSPNDRLWQHQQQALQSEVVGEALVERVDTAWESDDDDDDDYRAKARPYSAAYRDTNAGKVITTYAEYSARQEVPSIREDVSEDSFSEDGDEVDAAAAFEGRLAAGKARRSSPSGAIFFQDGRQSLGPLHNRASLSWRCDDLWSFVGHTGHHATSGRADDARVSLFGVEDADERLARWSLSGNLVQLFLIASRLHTSMTD